MSTEEISVISQILTACPVLLNNEEVDIGYSVCGEHLEVTYIRAIIGDEYGEWPTHYVSFKCGHTFADMENSLKNGEYL